MQLINFLTAEITKITEITEIKEISEITEEGIDTIINDLNLLIELNKLKYIDPTLGIERDICSQFLKINFNIPLCAVYYIYKSYNSDLYEYIKIKYKKYSEAIKRLTNLISINNKFEDLAKILMNIQLLLEQNFNILLSHNYECSDIKLLNILVQYNSSNIEVIENIVLHDFDTYYCNKYNIDSKIYLIYYKLVICMHTLEFLMMNKKKYNKLSCLYETYFTQEISKTDFIYFNTFMMSDINQSYLIYKRFRHYIYNDKLLKQYYESIYKQRLDTSDEKVSHRFELRDTVEIKDKYKVESGPGILKDKDIVELEISKSKDLLNSETIHNKYIKYKLKYIK